VLVFRDNGIDIPYGAIGFQVRIPTGEFRFTLVRDSIKGFADTLPPDSPPQLMFGISYLANYADRFGFKRIELPPLIRDFSGAAEMLRGKHPTASVDDRIRSRFSLEDIALCYLFVQPSITATTQQIRTRLEQRTPLSEPTHSSPNPPSDKPAQSSPSPSQP